MAVFVVENLSKVDDTNGVIVVASDQKNSNIAYAELQGPGARRAAIIKAAQLGLPDPRVNGSVNVYPVDKAGKEITDPRKQQVDVFRCDVPVVRRLV
jgi:hypothetical protein